LSCVLSGMGILNAHVEDSSRTVLKMEKKSLLDFIQKVNPQDLKMPGSKNEEESGEKVAEPSLNTKSDPKQVEEQIKKLDELEKAIEKEKDALKKASPLKMEKSPKKEIASIKKK
jgi:hypothetical protein